MTTSPGSNEKMEEPEIKPKVETQIDFTEKPKTTEIPTKSSMEILSELFNSFDAEPPLIIKKEPSLKVKKEKKHKKHKHKEKKKHKKRKRSSSDRSELDLAEILIKQEKESSEKRIKIEGTDLSAKIADSAAETEAGAREEGRTPPRPPARRASKRNGAEEGELRAEDEKRRKKRDGAKTKADRPRERRREGPADDLRHKLRGTNRLYARKSRSRSKSREKRHHDSSGDFYRGKRERPHRRDDGFYKEDDFWSRGRHKARRDERDRHYRARSKSHDSTRIDKKKLLEIARKNAIIMMKSGSLPAALTLGPQAQEKVIAAIRAGGKTIDELTDFCKTLSKKEELGELSSNSDGNASESDTDRPFNHPFQIKDRPTTITMNIKNSVPLPIKTTVERTSELRLQFPVSSGQLHRKTEGEWVPVPPKKSDKQEIKEPKTKVATTPTLLAIEAPPVAEPVAPPVASTETDVDLGSIVSQRLTAIRKLQENPNDVQALTEIYKVNKEMKSWAESKQLSGQFTGTTGANVMSQAELSSGYQAWARKDQLQTASPVSGGMGMHLLQKMGWKPGEGLGKEKTGALEPLLLEVKLDKKGLVATEEQKKKKKPVASSSSSNSTASYSLQNKHPVSLLGEYASKKKLGAPQYELCFECGPDHKKNFVFKVLLNGVEYKPNVASPNKKEAKAAAANLCLENIGVLGQPPALT